MKTKYFLSLLLGITYVLIPVFSSAQIDIILRRSFIDSFKHKVSIDSKYKVVHAHKRPNAPSKDGDLHIAGNDTKIGLPVVAELMNAKMEPDAMALIHENEEEETKTIKMSGVWRIWCEHAGDEIIQKQGAEFPPITNTNPDHVFEIHPVITVGNENCIKSLTAIDGFQYKDAELAFTRYAGVRCSIKKASKKMVAISTAGVGFNYVEFWIESIDKTQKEVEDGRFVFCKVLDKDGEVLYSKMRMVFPKDSEAEIAAQTMEKGDIMHVVGIPRINLALVAYRLDNPKKIKGILDWNLPIEMIIVSNLGE